MRGTIRPPCSRSALTPSQGGASRFDRASVRFVILSSPESSLDSETYAVTLAAVHLTYHFEMHEVTRWMLWALVGTSPVGRRRAYARVMAVVGAPIGRLAVESGVARAARARHRAGALRLMAPDDSTAL